MEFWCNLEEHDKFIGSGITWGCLELGVPKPMRELRA